MEFRSDAMGIAESSHGVDAAQPVTDTSHAEGEKPMKRVRHLYVITIFWALVVGVACGPVGSEPEALTTASGSDDGAPAYTVDPFWPKELPNNWILGRSPASPSTRRTTSGSSSDQAAWTGTSELYRWIPRRGTAVFRRHQ